MKDSNWIFIGLDGEMSSAELHQGGQLIQVGAAIWSGQPGENFARGRSGRNSPPPRRTR